MGSMGHRTAAAEPFIAPQSTRKSLTPAPLDKRWHTPVLSPPDQSAVAVLFVCIVYLVWSLHAILRLTGFFINCNSGCCAPLPHCASWLPVRLLYVERARSSLTVPSVYSALVPSIRSSHLITATASTCTLYTRSPVLLELPLQLAKWLSASTYAQISLSVSWVLVAVHRAPFPCHPLSPILSCTSLPGCGDSRPVKPIGVPAPNYTSQLLHHDGSAPSLKCFHDGILITG